MVLVLLRTVGGVGGVVGANDVGSVGTVGRGVGGGRVVVVGVGSVGGACVRCWWQPVSAL